MVNAMDIEVLVGEEVDGASTSVASPEGGKGKVPSELTGKVPALFLSPAPSVVASTSTPIPSPPPRRIPKVVVPRCDGRPQRG